MRRIVILPGAEDGKPIILEREETAAETAERERQAWLIIVKEKYQEAQDAFAALKARYDKLENWAKTKGYAG